MQTPNLFSFFLYHVKSMWKWRVILESKCSPVLLLLLVVIVVVKTNTTWGPVEGERPWRRVGPKKKNTYFTNHHQDTPSMHLTHRAWTLNTHTYTQTHVRAHAWHPAPGVHLSALLKGWWVGGRWLWCTPVYFLATTPSPFLSFWGLAFLSWTNVPVTTSPL